MQLIKGDCLEVLKTIPEKSVDLILTDPPYNIKLAEWDTWPTIKDYINFMVSIFKECERVLKDNGSLYFFHNDMLQIAYLMTSIQEKTNFNFNSFITWDKGDWRAQAWKYPTEENNLRSWFNTCEYCLYYNKRSGVQTEWDRTGLERVMLDPNNFKTLREYAYNMLVYIGKGSEISVKKINEDLGNRKAEHFFYCKKETSEAKQKILKDIGGAADHFTRYGSTQWDLCTAETYEKLTETYNLRAWENYREYEDLRREYEDLRREYEDLRREYEDLRFIHNLDFNHKNVFNYKRDTGDNLHPCQKPIEMLERLIKCGTKKDGLVLDCFMGSGSTGVAAVNTQRDFIGIELDENYFNIATERIKNAQAQGVLDF